MADRWLLTVSRLLILFSGVALAQSSLSAPKHTVKYGSNPAAGQTFVHDGVRLYFEVYGAGEPLLVVHGNGGIIADMQKQIAFFREHYKVIAMDSRDHGRSADASSREQIF